MCRSALARYSGIQHSTALVAGSVASTASSSGGQHTTTRPGTDRHASARLHHHSQTPVGPSQPRTISASTPALRRRSVFLGREMASFDRAAIKRARPLSASSKTCRPFTRAYYAPCLAAYHAMHALRHPSQAHATNGRQRRYKHSIATSSTTIPRRQRLAK